MASCECYGPACFDTSFFEGNNILCKHLERTFYSQIVSADASWDCLSQIQFDPDHLTPTTCTPINIHIHIHIQYIYIYIIHIHIHYTYTLYINIYIYIHTHTVHVHIHYTYTYTYTVHLQTHVICRSHSSEVVQNPWAPPCDLHVPQGAVVYLVANLGKMGISVRKLWKHDGLMLDLYGCIWIYMDLYGFIWIYMDLW